MENVTSADGTSIAFDRLGAGEPIILVTAALCDRSVTAPLAEALAEQYTVINFDRRGRGDSGDNEQYAVEREVEDLGALIEQVGGSAAVYGHSSGAALVLHAASQGLPISKLILHEPPYNPEDDELRKTAREFGTSIRALLAEDRRRDAVEVTLQATGMPEEMLTRMCADPGVQKLAHTLVYDSEVMGDLETGGTIPVKLISEITTPALVVCGGASPDWMIDVGRQIADTMPDGRLHVLEGGDHFVGADVLLPVLKAFLGD